VRTDRLLITVVLVATAGAVAVAGCSQSVDTTGAVAAGANGNGIETRSANEILAAAEASAKAATAVHVQGTAGGSDLDLRLSATAADAKVVHDGEHIEVLRVGSDRYLLGDAPFWTDAASAEAATKLAGRWVKLGPAQSAQYDHVLNIGSFFGEEFKSSSTVSKGDQAMVAGVRTIEVKDSSDRSTVYISMVGKPLPLKAESSASDGGSISFTDWNVPITDIAAPPAGSVVDASTLTGG
jgi:hypothetical protein